MLKVARVLSFKVNRNFGIIPLTYRKYCSDTINRDNGETEQNAGEPVILVEKDANITLIGINRGESRNSINGDCAQKLCDAFHEFENDATSPVAVIYGVGGSFCAGYDIQELQQQLDDNSLEFLLRHEGSIGPTRRHIRKPVICAINGFCVGSGIELALLCDLRVMEETAVLGFYNRRLGVPLSDGGTARLSASVGFSRAVDLIVSGRRVSASEALQMGFINRLVATGTSLGQAVNLAFSIEKFPQVSLQHDRGNVLKTYDKQRFRSAIQNELMHMSNELMAEMRQGIDRFKMSEKGLGSKTHTWNIREKYIPEWEKVEIAYEMIRKRKQKEDLDVQ